MTFKYRAITANCGNDSIGKTATAEIADCFKTDNLDFCIINAQELHCDKTLSDLRKAFPGHTVEVVGEMMVTKTKATIDVIQGKTGMASIIICSPSVNFQTNSTIQARRNPAEINVLISPKKQVTAYNKGGVINECTISKGAEHMRVQSISGHLDSSKVKERTQDWAVIQKQLSKPQHDIKSFKDLAETIPDIRIAGYDANTRSRLDASNKPMNMWETKADELQGMIQAPLGNARFSDPSTYKSNKEGIATDAAVGKRVGYTKGGMLDFVDILDGRKATGITIGKENQVITIPPGDKTTERDHDVVISPMIEHRKQNEFERVRDQMASMLEQSAPQLSEDIRCLPDDQTSKDHLVEVYQVFLSREGLVNKELELQTKRLGLQREVTTNKNPQLVSAAQDALKSDKIWFASVTINNYNSTVNDIKIRQTNDEQMIDTLSQSMTKPKGFLSGRFSPVQAKNQAISRNTSSESLLSSSNDSSTSSKSNEPIDMQASRSMMSRFRDFAGQLRSSDKNKSLESEIESDVESEESNESSKHLR